MPIGRKTCPQCHAEVPCRLKVCTCGAAFTPKPKTSTGKVRKGKATPSGPSTPSTGRTTVPGSPSPLAAVPSSPTVVGSLPPVPTRNLPPVPTRAAPAPKIVVNATDRAAISQFIADLTASLHAAETSGGCYSAFMPVKEGKLQVQIQTFSGRIEK